MKKIILIIPILILTLTSLTWGDTLDFGSRSSAPGGGITATGPWGPPEPFFEIKWAINYVGGSFPWKYNYTIYFPGKEISHWIFEVSEDAKRNDFDFSFLPTYIIVDNDSPRNWGQNYPGHDGNPGWPENKTIWGIKFDFDEEFIKGLDGVGFTFYSTRAPMWGDFYAKDGRDNGVWVIAYNIGFGGDPTAPYTNWIAVPDTKTIVPEPGLLILLGLGLTAVGVATRFVRKV